MQEVLAGLGERRDTIADAHMLEIARTIDPAATIVQPDVQDGAALLFDGRIWHSGRNDSASETRTALLLQYASADCPIPLPADGRLSLAFPVLDQPAGPHDPGQR